jgi:hypothetical protein
MDAPGITNAGWRDDRIYFVDTNGDGEGNYYLRRIDAQTVMNSGQ